MASGTAPHCLIKLFQTWSVYVNPYSVTGNSTAIHVLIFRSYPRTVRKNTCRPFLPKQTAELLKNHSCNPMLIHLGVLFALYTGVRIGELCGIRYEDIDMDEHTVTIRRTVERITNLDANAKTKTKLIISEPKTEHSVRMIPLPSFLIPYIPSSAGNSDCYLLTGTTKPTEPHQFYLRYKTFMKNHQMGSFTFHALRHTFATCCVEAGVDAKSLSEILGHSNINTTLSLYVHPTLEQKKKQMEKLMPLCEF